MSYRRSIASLAFVTVTLALAALPAAARWAAPPRADPRRVRRRRRPKHGPVAASETLAAASR